MSRCIKQIGMRVNTPKVERWACSVRSSARRTLHPRMCRLSFISLPPLRQRLHRIRSGERRHVPADQTESLCLRPLTLGTLASTLPSSCAARGCQGSGGRSCSSELRVSGPSLRVFLSELYVLYQAIEEPPCHVNPTQGQGRTCCSRRCCCRHCPAAGRKWPLPLARCHLMSDWKEHVCSRVLTAASSTLRFAVTSQQRCAHLGEPPAPT